MERQQLKAEALDNPDDVLEVGVMGAGNKQVDSYQNRINNVRDKMPNSKLKNRGNMAIADVKILGLKSEYVAHSQINVPKDVGADVGDFSFLKSENERVFQSYVEVGYPRYHDTEAKILEDIACQINGSNAKGTINLYTELPACQSCSNIILEFRNRFPIINLSVFCAD